MGIRDEIYLTELFSSKMMEANFFDMTSYFQDDGRAACAAASAGCPLAH